MNETSLLLFMISSAVCYYTAFSGLLLTEKIKALNVKPYGVISRAFWVLGAVLNSVVIINNYLVNGYVPFVSMFQVLTFLSFCFGIIYLYFRYICRCRGFGLYFALASAVVMTGPCFMDINSVWSFPPALQSAWFVPHILMYMISYSLGTVAFIMTVVSFFSKGKEIDRAIYCCSRTLFPFMTCGMFLGAVWADQVWGDFWSWDIKECWSLITWLIFMLSLHCFRSTSLKKYSKPLIILGFIGIVITFFFVNKFSGASVHSYS